MQNNQKGDDKKKVHCHGVLIHIGTLSTRKSRKLGDKLIVTLTSDRYVNKGPGRPVFNDKFDNCDAIAAIRCELIMLQLMMQALRSNNKGTEPNIYCKTDYKNFNDDITGEIKNELKP